MRTYSSKNSDKRNNYKAVFVYFLLYIFIFYTNGYPENKCISNTILNKVVSDTIFLYANQFRKQNFRDLFHRYKELDEVARLYAEFLCNSNQFSHKTKQGFDVTDRVNIMTRRLFTSCTGENLIKISGPTASINTQNAYEKGKSMQLDWEKSSGHRKTLLDKDYNAIGIGVAFHSNAIIGVQVFAEIIAELHEDFSFNQKTFQPDTVKIIIYPHQYKKDYVVCLYQLLEKNDQITKMGCQTTQNVIINIPYQFTMKGLSFLYIKINDQVGVGPKFLCMSGTESKR